MMLPVYSTQNLVRWFFVSSAVLWQFKSFCLALWLSNILVVNGVAKFGRLQDFLGHEEHNNLYMVSEYFTVLLIYKTKFLNPCHALKNSVVVKGLIKIRS